MATARSGEMTEKAGTSVPVADTGMEVPDGETREVEHGRRHHKVTPLPLDQMVPMTFVLLNESIGGTMLLPFVGLLVAHLKDVPVEAAGYDSGTLIGVFMLGQVVSSRMWGRLSDRYGRRFPLVCGLFTSGLMMLGFGLSTNVWVCALFRFFHGLFNGNVMVAKTMMADITDKTNAAKGFAFVSLCYGIGILIGPALGGLLYDPAHSSALRWMHISEESIFSRRPALLPSLVTFIYSNIGMLVCTFFVQESNPHAQPLPILLRYLYPCFWREPRMFVHPSLRKDANPEATSATSTASPTASNLNGVEMGSGESSGDDILSIRSAERLVRNVAMTSAVPSMCIASPVLREDPRFDHIVFAESLACATEQGSAVTPRYGMSHPACQTRASREDDPERADGSTSAIREKSGTPRGADKASAPAVMASAADEEGQLFSVEAEDGPAAQTTESGAAELQHFGYVQALQNPITRTMLVLYMLLNVADMAVQEILPLWAIAGVAKGGLGFGAEKVGYILFTNSVPCVVSNLLFHTACTRFEDKLVLFRHSIMMSGAAVMVLPLISYLELGWFVFPAIVLCTSVRQFFASWYYGLVTMLTAHSVPPSHMGSIMGINQSCGAAMRALVPFVVTPLFAWSITSDHPFPFDHVFVFFLSGGVFAVSYVYSAAVRTVADGSVEMVERHWGCIGAAVEWVRERWRHLRGGSTTPS